MRKAILVLDMPQTCGTCPICQGIALDGEYVCSIRDEDSDERGYDDGKYSKPDWCPLHETVVTNLKCRELDIAEIS